MRGNPAPFLAKLIKRIDRLKDEMVTAGEYLAWADSLAAAATTRPSARRPRAKRSSRGSMRRTTRCSTRPAQWTSAR